MECIHREQRRRVLKGIIIKDCCRCGEILWVEDSHEPPRFRPSRFRRFLQVWRSLEPGNYLISALQKLTGLDPKTIFKYSAIIDDCGLDGNLYRDEVYGVVERKDPQTHRSVSEYVIHKTIVKEWQLKSTKVIPPRTGRMSIPLTLPKSMYHSDFWHLLHGKDAYIEELVRNDYRNGSTYVKFKPYALWVKRGSVFPSSLPPLESIRGLRQVKEAKVGLHS